MGIGIGLSQAKFDEICQKKIAPQMEEGSVTVVVFVLTKVECLRIFHLTALFTLASLCYTFLAPIYSLCSIICLSLVQDA